MQMIEIEKLIPHPRSREFFDDIQGDRWEDFKESIVRRGVVEPVILTQDLIIVSGHQRVKACRELGIISIPSIITIYLEFDGKNRNQKDDRILEDLICTNLMQRGVGNVNPMKMAKCIIEMERIYGIKKGGNRYADKSDFQYKDNKTQYHLAETLGMTTANLYRYKKLLSLIPEIQSLIEDNKIKSSIGSQISKLTQEDQSILYNSYDLNTLTVKSVNEIIENRKYIVNVFHTEKALEEKVINNINLIEDGMKYIGSQVEVNGGIIDILAEDINGNTCIIELKIKSDDERIAFQCLYYPKEIKSISNKNIKTSKIRMITICPDYTGKIRKVLRDIKGVEMKRYILNRNNELEIHNVS